MVTPENEEFNVDPEMERIWNEEEDPSFAEIRANIDLEQPEDTAETEDSEEMEEETVSTKEEEPEVEEESEEEEQPADEPEDAEEESEKKAVEESFRVKANGSEYDFSLEELKQLAPKAMDYTKKMQEIAPWRKSISALKDNGLGENDVNLMIDVLKGDKAAIEEVLRRTKVDTLDLDTDKETNYVPKQYGKDESAQAIEDVVSQISADAEYATTAKVVDDIWDGKSRQTMAENPDMIMGLHADIKNGTYSKVAPIAEKMKALDGGRLSDIEYYMQAGQQLFSQQAEPEEVVKQDTRQADAKAMASKRKAATPTKSNSGKRDVINYLDDNDEDYDAWYAALQARN